MPAELEFDIPKYTLSGIRDVFLQDNVNLSEELDLLGAKFLNWSKEPVYCSAQYQDVYKNKEVYKIWKAPKRGNEIYVKQTMARINERLPDSERIRKDGLLADVSGVNVLHLVLTYDPKRYGLNETWERSSSDVNRFITAFRKRYGKTWVFKTFEAHESGYIHIHIFMICEHEFNAKWRDCEAGKRWIIPEKESKHEAPSSKNMVSGFQELWKHGHVKAVGVGTSPKKREKGFDIAGYIAKYVGSDITSLSLEEFENSNNSEMKKKVYTQALNWLFRKRAFSISGKKVLDLILISVIQTEKKIVYLRKVFEGARYSLNQFTGLVTCSVPPPEDYFELSKTQEKQLKERSAG